MCVFDLAWAKGVFDVCLIFNFVCLPMLLLLNRAAIKQRKKKWKETI